MRRGLAASIGLLLTAAVAAAEPVEEIVVTAQKREQAINDVPIAVTAFSGETLKDLGITDTRDLNNLVPGFTASESGYNTPIYTLRGVGFNDTTYTATSTVGVYVDEISLPYSIMTKGTNLDLARVEVLKGPQGTLYGRNATGGAINYVANKPTEELAAGITTSLGRFWTSDVESFVSGPIFSRKLRGRVAFRDIHSQDGWQVSNTRPDDRLGQIDKQSGRGILEWDATESLRFSLMVGGWRDGSDAQAAQPIAFLAQNPILGEGAAVPSVRNYPYVGVDEDDPRLAEWCPKSVCHRDFELRDSFYQVALTAKWSLFENVDVTGIGSFAKVESDGSDIPQSALNQAAGEQSIFADIETANGEVRVDGRWSDAVHWMIGGNVAFDDGSELHDSFFDKASALFPVGETGVTVLGKRYFISGDTEARSLGVFADADWQLTKTLKVTAGLRYTDESRDFSGCSKTTADNLGVYAIFTALALSRGGRPFAPGDCHTIDANGDNDPRLDPLKERNVSSRLVLDWRPTDGALFYGSLTRGFKSGGFPVLNSSDQSQYTPATQERLHAAEAGAKVDLFDRLAHANFAGFYYDYKDKQLLTFFRDPLFGPLPLLRNAPKSHVWGLELDVSSAPLDGLVLSGAVSYIRTEIDEFVSTNTDGVVQNFAGRPFNFAPEWTATVRGDYSREIFSGYTAGIGLDYYYRDQTNSTLDGHPFFRHAAYGLVNGRLRFGPTEGKWAVGVWSRNMTNEFATVSVFRAAADAVARYGGRPLDYGVSASYSF